MDAEAILAYGYDLGVGHRPKLLQADDRGHLHDVRWYSATSEHGLIHQATNHLLTEAGVDVPRWPGERRDSLKRHLGVWFKEYGDHDDPGFVLTAYVMTGDWEDDPTPLDFAELNRQVVQHHMDTKLADVLETLGVTPAQERPMWLLCSLGN